MYQCETVRNGPIQNGFFKYIYDIDIMTSLFVTLIVS